MTARPMTLIDYKETVLMFAKEAIRQGDFSDAPNWYYAFEAMKKSSYVLSEYWTFEDDDDDYTEEDYAQMVSGVTDDEYAWGMVKDRFWHIDLDNEYPWIQDYWIRRYVLELLEDALELIWRYEGRN